MSEEMNRRSFLQLIGIGSAAAAAGPSKIFTGGDLAPAPPLTGEHWVFDGHCALRNEGKAHFLYKTPEGEVSTLQLRRGTGTMRVRGESGVYPFNDRPKPRSWTWSPQGELVDYQVQQVHLGRDQGFDFFMAASQLQRQINEDITKFASVLRQDSLVMVTVVDMPIMAIPHPDGGGLGLMCQLSQFAARKEYLVGKAISTKGEVPIEMPSDVEFHFLTKMQDELRQMGMLDQWNSFGSRRRTEIAAEAHKRVLYSS